MTPLLLALGCTGASTTVPPTEGTTPVDTSVSPTGETGSVSGSTGDTAPQGYVGPFDHCGELLHARRLGDTIGNVGYDLAAANDGGVAHAGSFSGTAVFGPGEPNETAVTASFGSVYSDGFVARYAADGTLVWVRQHLDSWYSKAHAVAVHDGTGRVAVAGTYSAELTLEGGGVSHTLPTAFLDVFVASYTADGTLEWAVSLRSPPGDEEVGDIAFADDGAVYFAGWTLADAVAVTSTQGSSLQLTDLGPVDNGESAGLLVRIEPDGQLGWAQTFLGEGIQELHDVTVTAAGDVVVLGEFFWELWLDRGGPDQQRLPWLGHSFFHASFATDGRLQSVVRSTSEGSPELGGIRGVGTGVVVGAYLPGTATWASGTPEARAMPEGAAVLANLEPVTQLERLDVFYDYDPTILNSRISMSAIDARESGESAAVGFSVGLTTLGKGQPNEVTTDTGPYRWNPLLVTLAPDGTLDCFWEIEGQKNLDQAYGVAFDTDGGVWVTGKFHDSLTLAKGRPSEVTLTSSSPINPDLFLARFQLRPEP